VSEHPASGSKRPIVTEQRGNVLVITLDRPSARNAVTRELTIEVGQAMDRAESDPSIWAVILTGSGDRAFCAGVDLRALAAGDLDDPDERMLRWGFAGWVAHPISKPTIAALNGPALGGGAEIALASDLIVAADHATIGLPEVTRGVLPGGGGAFRLPRQMPRKLAMELILTGRPITAGRALELGLVNRVVPLPSLMEEAMSLAEEICANGPLAVQASKRIAKGIDDDRIASEEADWARSDRELAAIMGTADAREGVAAFAERRPPRWSAS